MIHIARKSKYISKIFQILQNEFKKLSRLHNICQKARLKLQDKVSTENGRINLFLFEPFSGPNSYSQVAFLFVITFSLWYDITQKLQMCKN